MAIPLETAEGEVDDEDTPRSFLQYMAWVGLVIGILVVGLGVLTFRINDKVDRISQQSINIEQSAKEAEIAAKKASEDLANALAQAEERRGGGVSTEELRQVFQLILDIKTAVCSGNQHLEGCQD